MDFYSQQGVVTFVITKNVEIASTYSILLSQRVEKPIASLNDPRGRSLQKSVVTTYSHHTSILFIFFTIPAYDFLEL